MPPDVDQMGSTLGLIVIKGKTKTRQVCIVYKRGWGGVYPLYAITVTSDQMYISDTTTTTDNIKDFLRGVYLINNSYSALKDNQLETKVHAHRSNNTKEI